MIDFHSHTTASDGELGPAELVERARKAGITRLAVTDHDTVNGLAEAVEAARLAGDIEVIPGIEISTRVAGEDIHLLGHFVRPDDPALVAFCARQEGERRRRMERMVEKLNALGIPVRMERVEEVAGGSENLCRPHLARALVQMGRCATMQEAFERYIGDGGPAFAAQERIDAKDAIALVHGAGGTATLAHPAVDRMDRGRIRLLAADGLDGLEVFHPDHDAATRERYLAIARELSLVPTAGSDFHGGDTAPDHGLGSASLAPEHYAALWARRGGAAGNAL